MKAHIVTLGCPKNLVDSEATIAVLRGAGCEITEDPRDADLFLVGACSFLDAAWRETVEEVERLAEYRGNGNDKRLVLMGCLPRHRGGDLEAELPWVDHFLPTGAHEKLPALLESWRKQTMTPAWVDGAGVDRFAAYEGRELLTPPHTAYVKAAEGCNRNCSFCAIPTIRGRQVARPVAAVVSEVQELVGRGVREVTLLSQDIVAYRHGGSRLPDLIDAITATGIEWVRILYVHPAGLTGDYMARLFEHPAVCRYLEMPVQHASSRLLRQMKRGCDRRSIEKLISDTRKAFPDIVIRSEVIVGFPGETESDFEELKEFVQEIEFDSLGIFPYSTEPGTEAASMPGAVSPEMIRYRAGELTSLQEAVSFASRSRFLGRTVEVLVDRRLEGEEARDGYSYAGRFYGQALEVDGEVLIDAGVLETGIFVDVHVTDADAFDLRGKVKS